MPITLLFYEIIHETSNTWFENLIKTYKSNFLETHLMWLMYLLSPKGLYLARFINSQYQFIISIFYLIRLVSFVILKHYFQNNELILTPSVSENFLVYTHVFFIAFSFIMGTFLWVYTKKEYFACIDLFIKTSLSQSWVLRSLSYYRKINLFLLNII